MSEKYRPSNGTEGDMFMLYFCECCKKNKGELGCDIQLRTMAHDIDEPEYPAEWKYGEDGEPTCTAHEMID